MEGYYHARDEQPMFDHQRRIVENVQASNQILIERNKKLRKMDKDFQKKHDKTLLNNQYESFLREQQQLKEDKKL